MRRALVACAILAITTAATGVAEAEPEAELACRRVRHEGMNDGPVVIGLFDAELGTGRAACLRSELALYERLAPTIDLPDFYGGLRLDTVVAGTARLRPRLALFGALELVHYELVQNASIKATAVGLGQLTMGLQGLAFEGRRFALSAYGRVLVPTATYTPQVQTTGAEIGFSALYRPRRDVEVHAQLAGDFTVGLAAGPVQARGGTSLSIGAQYTPASWFALAVDLQVVLGHRAALDAFLPMLALRFRVWRSLGLELAGTSPVAGADRRLALATLRVGYRF